MTTRYELTSSYVASQILGDGCLRDGNIHVRHQQEWLDYLFWKRNIAINLGLDVTEVRQWTQRSNISVQNVCGFYVRPPLVFTIYSGPVDLVNRLDSLGLLLWWLDDGCLSIHEKKNGTSVSRFGYLNTEAFDNETNCLLSIALEQRFGIKTSIHIDRGGIKDPNKAYYRLYLNAMAMRLLIDIVRPHLHGLPESMIYKLNMGYRPNRNHSSLEYSQKYNF